MYIPKYFRVTDMDEIREFVQMNSFGTIVTTKQGKPIATHLPLQFNKEGDDYYITGHMAYGNPQWRTLETCEDILVMYQGPHAYISSSWYGHEKCTNMELSICTCIWYSQHFERRRVATRPYNVATKKYEKNTVRTQFLWDKLFPSVIRKKELKGIVGFKIKVQEIQASYKLSQNRNEEDYHNIVNKLSEEKGFKFSTNGRSDEKKRVQHGK
ncbi:protease synthase/sporulation negative transcriptional regulator PaiB [Ectobacillus funiculus]